MGKDIIYVKEKIKRYNIIQRCLTSTLSQKKTYAKDPYKAKYQLLIKKKRKCRLKYLNNYSNDMDDVYKNIEDNPNNCNPNEKRKILILFDDRIADMPSNKKLNSK